MNRGYGGGNNETNLVEGVTLKRIDISIVVGLLVAGHVAAAPPDVTKKLELLGNPYKKKYKSGQRIYARNIWDMMSFKGKLYLGGGNSSNTGPGRNAGPVPIISYDPKSGKFTQEYVVKDEQIDLIYNFDGQLYVPGHDPKESWNLGNFYRLEADGKWQKHRNLPGGIHNYAMAWDGKRLFAGLGTKKGAIVAVSEDKGKTWTTNKMTGGRVYSLLTIGDTVCAGSMILVMPKSSKRRKYSYAPLYGYKNGKFERLKDISSEDLLPDTHPEPKKRAKDKRAPGYVVAKIVKPLTVGKHTLYIGAACHNDHQFMPLGAYVIDAKRKARKIELPEGSRPWDIIHLDKTTYVLIDTPAEDGTTVTVMATRDMKRWRPLFTFAAPTFARSFELLDGDFFFGLGCEVKDPKKWDQKELKPETGNILRLRGGRSKK